MDNYLSKLEKLIISFQKFWILSVLINTNWELCSNKWQNVITQYSYNNMKYFIKVNFKKKLKLNWKFKN